MKKKWWKYLFDIDVIFVIIIIIAVIYCIFTQKKKKKYQFLGLDVDVGEARREWHDSSIEKRKKKKKKQKLNKHEEKCREIFEGIFNVPFKSTRPKWLENPVTGRNLELDGFNPHIKTPIGRGLAFEYDGKQHSHYNPHFHKNGKQEFVYQVKKDSWKDLRCEQEGVLLIRIPHFVLFDDLEKHIRQKLYRKGMLQSQKTRGDIFSGLYDY